MRGVCPKRRSMPSARRVLSRDFIRHAARMKTPRMKNTASLPNSAKALLAGMTPVSGSMMMASRLVIMSGSTLVTQRTRQTTKMPSDLSPASESPSGGGRVTTNQ